MNMKICLMPGDGIGPEIVTQAVMVLERVAAKFGHTVETETALIGGAAIDAVGTPLPDTTVAACKAADAVLLGAVGGPLSYWGGVQLAGAGLPLGTWPSLLVLAAVWALLLPVLHRLGRPTAPACERTR